MKQSLAKFKKMGLVLFTAFASFAHAETPATSSGDFLGAESFTAGPRGIP